MTRDEEFAARKVIVDDLDKRADALAEKIYALDDERKRLSAEHKRVNRSYSFELGELQDSIESAIENGAFTREDLELLEALEDHALDPSDDLRAWIDAQLAAKVADEEERKE